MILEFNSFQTPLNKLINLYNRITRRNKAIGISTAVAFIVNLIHDSYFKLPRKLRHIPYFSYSSVIKSLFAGDSIFDRERKVNLPQMVDKTPNELYLEPRRPGWEIHVSNPEDAKRILLKADIFPKFNITAGNEDTIIAKFVGGPNILTLAGQSWKNQRKVANPAFRRSMPVKLFGRLTQDLFKVINEPTVNVSDLMLRWTLEAIGKAGFGFDFHAIDQSDNEWLQVYNEISDGLKDRKFFLFPVLDTKLVWLFPQRQQLHRNLDKSLSMLNRVVLHKRDMIKQGNLANEDLEENERDLLTLMIESEIRGEGLLSDAELKSNLCLFFFAGHDTTAAALSYALYHLAKNPDIQQKAREEAIAVLGDAPQDILPSAEGTKHMIYINQVMKETLRINDPAPRVVARQVQQDTVLSCGTFIPKDLLLTVNIYNIHHSDKVWKNRDMFDPSRFDQGGAESDGLAWLPFGNESRQCLGMNFSLNEQRVMLSMLLRKYTWTIPENSPHKDGLITAGFPMVSPTDLYLTFHPRY